MFKTINTNVIQPLAVRLGTAATGFLVGQGINAQHADSIGIGVAAVLLVGCDLLASWLRRRQIVNQTVNALFPDAKP